MVIRYLLSRKDQETFLLQTLETPASVNRMKILRIAMIIFPALVMITGYMGAIRYHVQSGQSNLDAGPFLTVTIAAASLFLLIFIGVYGIPVFSPWYVKRLVKKKYSELEGGEALMENPVEATLDISEQALRGRVGEIDFEYSQPFINRLIETNDYLAYVPKNGKKGLIIPRWAFQSDDEFAQFKQLLMGYMLDKNRKQQ